MIGKKEALEWLRKITGQDFGIDAAAWSEWLKKNRWAYYRTRPFSSGDEKSSDDKPK
jgi:hypothetical protein